MQGVPQSEAHLRWKMPSGFKLHGPTLSWRFIIAYPFLASVLWSILKTFVDLHTGYLEATKISQQNWGPQRIQGFPVLKNGGTEETYQKEILCLPSAEMKYVERRSELFSVWPFCNKTIQNIQNTEKTSYQTCHKISRVIHADVRLKPTIKPSEIMDEIG